MGAYPPAPDTLGGLEYVSHIRTLAGQGSLYECTRADGSPVVIGRRPILFTVDTEGDCCYTRSGLAFALQMLAALPRQTQLDLFA